LRVSKRDQGVTVITPHLNPQANRISAQQQLFFDFFYRQKIRTFISWYTSPIFMPCTSHLRPEFVVYDCADADGGTKVEESEYELFTIADLVLADGLSQYEAKAQLHPNVHAFLSCIDFDHFSRARVLQLDPLDQRDIPYPRLGYYGVIDERMNQELIDAVAEKRPEWHWIFVGPVLRIDPEKLPRRSNIHYLGDKDHKSLPSYMSGWNVAVLPLAGDDACRCMSSGKTFEYLAAGKPVVSTPVRDVVRPYGERGLVSIANDVTAFIAGIEKSLLLGPEWRKKVDSYLWNLSWDQTCARMNRLLAEVWTDAKAGQHHTAPRFVAPERKETNVHA
jgi:UDP-galactopyranose mutase